MAFVPISIYGSPCLRRSMDHILNFQLMQTILVAICVIGAVAYIGYTLWKQFFKKDETCDKCN
ncbi:MAG: FeoB-associated Cys-rich membrane protein [Bacteroidetes bacterium]|nr:MAG: FeoB-associated Cys-rich membrane protein [Bacteroidota bacterium]